MCNKYVCVIINIYCVNLNSVLVNESLRTPDNFGTSLFAITLLHANFSKTLLLCQGKLHCQIWISRP